MNNKKLRLSFSSTGDYKTCPYKYKFKYIDNLVSKDQGASLAFGGAIDKAIEGLLLGSEDYFDIFLNDKSRGWNNSFDDSNIFYTRRDYNDSIFGDSDLLKIKSWENELGTTLNKALDAEKSKKYKRFNGNNLKLFNRCCWLSMIRLGFLMLDAFYKKVKPNIEEVIAVQKNIRFNLGDSVSVIGYIDLIVRYKGVDKPVIFDIKTSRMSYDKDKILLSDQLRIYNYAYEKKYGRHKVGYIVLIKTLDKEFKCSKCNKEKPQGSKARNCVENGCEGKYIKQYVVNPQILIDEYSREDLDNYLKEFINVAKLIKSGLFYKNYEGCHKYNALCAYYGICHFNKDDNLIKRGEK